MIFWIVEGKQESRIISKCLEGVVKWCKRCEGGRSGEIRLLASLIVKFVPGFVAKKARKSQKDPSLRRTMEDL